MLRFLWNQDRKRKREGGFTLIELVVVLAILGILIALGVPRYLGARRRSYAAEARNVLQELKTLEWAYYQQWSSFTTNAGSLGFAPPSGAIFTYSVTGAGATNATLVANGTGPAVGISIQLLLSNDGSSALTESF